MVMERPSSGVEAWRALSTEAFPLWINKVSGDDFNFDVFATNQVDGAEAFRSITPDAELKARVDAQQAADPTLVARLLLTTDVVIFRVRTLTHPAVWQSALVVLSGRTLESYPILLSDHEWWPFVFAFAAVAVLLTALWHHTKVQPSPLPAQNALESVLLTSSSSSAITARSANDLSDSYFN